MSIKSKHNIITLVAGGTGGHIYPALAILYEIKKTKLCVGLIFFCFNNVENLVHRDIAARNVLLSENYVAKLTGTERKNV